MIPITSSADAHEKPAIVSISATDVLGRAVSVPSSSMPSIIVIARARAERPELFDAVARQTGAQIVVILSGADPERRTIVNLAARENVRILLDPDTSLARRLDVSGRSRMSKDELVRAVEKRR